MDGKLNILSASGLPAELGLLIGVLSLALLVVPLFAGQNYGLFKIPWFSQNNKKTYRKIGVVLLILTVALHIPFLDQANSIKQFDGQTGLNHLQHDTKEAIEKAVDQTEPIAVTFDDKRTIESANGQAGSVELESEGDRTNKREHIEFYPDLFNKGSTHWDAFRGSVSFKEMSADGVQYRVISTQKDVHSFGFGLRADKPAYTFSDLEYGNIHVRVRFSSDEFTDLRLGIVIGLRRLQGDLLEEYCESGDGDWLDCDVELNRLMPGKQSKHEIYVLTMEGDVSINCERCQLEIARVVWRL